MSVPAYDRIGIGYPGLRKDGLFCGLWDRPEMHLDPEVRCGSSVWNLMPPEEVGERPCFSCELI